MTRSAITVRPAGEHDLGEVLRLFAEVRRCGGLPARVAALAQDDTIAEYVRRLATRPDCRVLLASIGGRAVGMAVVTTARLEALSEAPCVQIEYTVVAEAYRRRGVGRALLSGALSFADDIGAEHITASVAPMLREANRFYAQLGFTPLVVRRAAAVASLRRRLATVDLATPRRDSLARRRPVAGRAGVRAALRRIAVAPGVADQPRDA